MTDPLARILNRYPSAYFQYLAEEMDAAFAKALRITQEHYDEPEWAGMLGQARHGCLEDAFRAAARAAGLTTTAAYTDPPGGRYSLVSQDGVYLIRCNVQTHCGPPRPSRFRSEWSALNAWLSPTQIDMLRPSPPPSPDMLCGMVVVTANRRGGDQRLPAFVGLGVPLSDLSEWHAIMSIHDVLARYTDLAAPKDPPREAPIEVKDQAMPRLKKPASDGSAE